MQAGNFVGLLDQATHGTLPCALVLLL